MQQPAPAAPWGAKPMSVWDIENNAKDEAQPKHLEQARKVLSIV
jgi:hypothetical protein